ncbi:MULTISPECIES: ATP-binding protein [unclassified Streptomyces]|uniref:ATP-binding protein n=1 Tax=unclassified Streptomyces TaxID=2593676 RepID=UPI001EF8C459|nr:MULTISPECIES: ATP-binding protein [unclassified Streptomyces]
MNQEIAFVATLPATPHGARAARQLTAAQLADWGLPFHDAAQVVAELASNAVTHGRVPGRGFRLRISTSGGTLRIEVSETRAECAPPSTAEFPSLDAESGRGMALVAALADRWGVSVGPVPLKTVWAEIGTPHLGSPDLGIHDPVDDVAVAHDVNRFKDPGK